MSVRNHRAIFFDEGRLQHLSLEPDSPASARLKRGQRLARFSDFGLAGDKGGLDRGHLPGVDRGLCRKPDGAGLRAFLHQTRLILKLDERHIDGGLPRLCTGEDQLLARGEQRLPRQFHAQFPRKIAASEHHRHDSFARSDLERVAKPARRFDQRDKRGAAIGQRAGDDVDLCRGLHHWDQQSFWQNVGIGQRGEIADTRCRAYGVDPDCPARAVLRNLTEGSGARGNLVFGSDSIFKVDHRQICAARSSLGKPVLPGTGNEQKAGG